MPTFVMDKTYQNAAVLTETDLDNMKESIETFINTTKLDSSNIQAGGIESANLADGAVTETQLAVSVAGAGLTGGAGTPLAINPDNNTVEISSGTLRVKPAGITGSQIASGVALAGNVTVAGSLGLTGLGLIEMDSPVTNKYRLLAEYTSTGSLLVLNGQIDENTILRTQRGYVNANATIGAGNNFSVVSAGTGAYTITFGVAFVGIPSIHVDSLGTYNGTNFTAARGNIYAISASAFSVTIDLNGTLTNKDFWFTATGALF